MATREITVNGNTYNDGAYDPVTNTKGLANGGHRQNNNLINMLLDVLADASSPLLDSSVTSLTIGTGSKTLTLADNRPIPEGSYCFIIDTADPTKWMWGQVTDHTDDQLTVNVTSTNGAGAGIITWTIQPSGPQGPAGSVPLATNTETKAGTSTTVAVTPASLFSVIAALMGKRTDVSSGTTAGAAFTRYRLTGTATLTLPTFGADEWLIVEFGMSAGSTGTVGRNSQTIDGVAADDTSTRYGDVVLYYCESAGVVTTKQIGMIP